MYTQSCNELHLRTILQNQISHHMHDIKISNLKLPCDMQFVAIVYKNAIAHLEEQKYTRIGLTHLSAWNQFSFARIDNRLPHFKEDGTLPNCIFICRMFNAPRHKLCGNKKLVTVSDDARASIARILDLTFNTGETTIFI